MQKYFMAEPRRFVMSRWGFKVRNKHEWYLRTLTMPDLSDEMPPCKSAHCIAGTANLLTGGKRLGAHKRAARQLGIIGLDEVELFNWHPLFVVNGWPEIFRDQYRRATTPLQRAKVACARLDYLVTTGK